MGAGGGADGAHGVHADVDRGVKTQGGLRILQIVVDGAGDADAGHAQLAQGQRALVGTVPADDHKARDVQVAQELDRFLLVFQVVKLFTACRAKVGAGQVRDVQHGVQGQLLVAVLRAELANQAVVTTLDANQGHAGQGGKTRHLGDGGVHAGAVPAAGEHCDFFHGFTPRLCVLGRKKAGRLAILPCVCLIC